MDEIRDFYTNDFLWKQKIRVHYLDCLDILEKCCKERMTRYNLVRLAKKLEEVIQRCCCGN